MKSPMLNCINLIMWETNYDNADKSKVAAHVCFNEKNEFLLIDVREKQRTI